jgi:hypothetical protein
MNTIIKCLAAALLLAAYSAHAQTYVMPAGTTTACSGTFYDPGGTSNYTDPGPAQTYTSTFSSGSAQVVAVNFTSFNTEQTGDWLYIYDGPTTSSPLIGSYTGAQNPFTVTSSGSSITFSFVTNGNGWANTGWVANISCAAAQTSGTFMLLNNTSNVTIPCGGTSEFYDRGGAVFNYFPAVATYTATYAAAAGQTLQFNFDLFNTELYGDWLYIYDGSSTAAPLIGMYSGSPATPFVITSSSNTLTFRFVDNGNGSTGMGWHAFVTCSATQGGNTFFMGNSTAPVLLPCGATSMFYDHGGSTNNYYAPGTPQTYTTTYSAPAGQTISVNFTSFFSEYNGDWLYVYDGANTSAPLIAQLGGVYPGAFEISSSSNTLTFRLAINANGSVGSGWTAAMTCSATQTASTFIVCNSPLPVSIPCGVTSKIYDLGGPGNNYITTGTPQSYSTTFSAPPGQYIQITFNSLNTEHTNDKLNVYDGSSTTDPLIGQYTGSQNTPLVVTSTSNTITLQFTENGSASSSGWSADIACVSMLGPSTFTLASSAQPVTVSCSGSNYFCDTGGEVNNYVDNSVSTSVTTYVSYTAQVMQFTFTSFGTQSGDILYVYDGQTTASPLLATYTGFPATPFTITSTTNYITFRFVTNGAGANFGWKAQIACTGTPLPIELLNFDAMPDAGKVKVEWVTATEINNDYFTVERSIDGLGFSPVGVVDGAGNSANILDYDFIDTDPYQGTSYYRLKQTDFNGDFSYSQVEAVNLSGMDIIQVFPNPAEDEVRFLLGASGEAVITIRIIDKLGRVLHEDVKYIEEDLTLHVLDVSAYAPGIYTICIVGAGHETFLQEQFIK